MYTIEKTRHGYHAIFTCSNGLISRYPSFDTLRDLHIYMSAVTHGNYKHGVVGNVRFNFDIA
jgi:hypothetical protein